MHARVLRFDSVKEVVASFGAVANILRRFEHRVLLQLNVDTCVTFLCSSDTALFFYARLGIAT